MYLFDGPEQVLEVILIHWVNNIWIAFKNKHVFLQ